MFFYRILLSLIFSVHVTACAEERREQPGTSEKFNVVTVVGNLDRPWSLAFLPGGKFLVTERSGRLLLFEKDGRYNVVSGLPEIASVGQGGLLDVIADPDFKTNRTIYFSYVAEAPQGYGTEVARAVLEESSLRDLRIIFRAQPKTSASIHFGSRLLVAPDSSLIITLGEKGLMHEAQKPSNHLGSVIRINRDGTIPQDNPFINRIGICPICVSIPQIV